jgi:hypothetical protein
MGELSALKELETGYVQLLNTQKEYPDLEVVCNFISKCISFSYQEADEMILMIKHITHINGKEIPLPKSFKKLHGNVMDKLNRYQIPIEQVFFELPVDIWGNSPHSSDNNAYFISFIVFLCLFIVENIKFNVICLLCIITIILLFLQHPLTAMFSTYIFKT